jgi:hypothetical protein
MNAHTHNNADVWSLKPTASIGNTSDTGCPQTGLDWSNDARAVGNTDVEEVSRCCV